MSDWFIVKSSLGNYKVVIDDDPVASLETLLQDGDCIVADRRVLNAHEKLSERVRGHGRVIEIEATEEAKSYEGVVPLIGKLIKSGFRRNNRLIAIGGGITQDITGFISSIIYRGVDWFFLPTTLLAQGDSCIGSKTSINFQEYKNQLGNFYPPRAIYIATTLLSTLDERDIRSGIGEMAHYFYVGGPEDVKFFDQRYRGCLDGLVGIGELISASLAIKKAYIEKDEFDRKERIVFNYGHTFGHAIESVTKYVIPHGLAVTFGMDMANYISYKKQYIAESDFDSAHEMYAQIWKGFSISNLSLDNMLDAMLRDKKNVAGKLGLILTKGWGKMFKDLTPPDETFLGWMQEYFRRYERTKS